MTDEIPQEEVDRRFAAQIHDDSKRTFYCAPGQFEAVQQMVAAKGWGDHAVVKISNLIVDESNVYVVDENAIDAAMAKHKLGRLL